MNIEFPEESGGVKYVWANCNNEDYVRFGCTDIYKHREILKGLSTQIDEELGIDHVKSAGFAYIELEQKKITVKFGRSMELIKYDPKGFKELIESNTEYQVELKL